MNLTKKIAVGVAVGFFTLGFSQSLEYGIVQLDSHKFASAKTNFQQMISNDDDAENYFYYGNALLQQFQPDYKLAEENFKKGLDDDKRSYVNMIGIASIKLAKGDKSAIQEIKNIVEKSRERDPEVLYRAGEALVMFEGNQDANLAVEYLDKAIELSAKKKGTPAHYFYTLGDAYRAMLTNNPVIAGKALTAYEKALPIAKNKASVHTRIGTLWMAAQQWQKAFESIQKAISADETYAPAYKALAGYYIRYQQNAEATQSLIQYAQYADEDPSTQFEIAKLFFMNEDYVNSKSTLAKVFNVINDPVKYKLQAYLEYGTKNYEVAKKNLDTYVSQVSTSELIPSDKGLEGLLDMAMAKSIEDEAQKEAIYTAAQNKINIAKQAKDETLDWDLEVLKVKGGVDKAAVEAGPTSPKIQELNAKLAKTPNDLNLLVELGGAYQEVKNWNGAIFTWDKLIALSPNWGYSYYAKGIAYQQMNNNELAHKFYAQYIDLMEKKTPEEQAQNKEAMSYAYYLLSYYENDAKNTEKAKELINKSIQMNPANETAIEFRKHLDTVPAVVQ